MVQHLAVHHFAVQHLAAPPEWGWYIVWYFFLGGLAGGAYLLGTLLRRSGDPGDLPMARLAFVVSLAATAICPVLLTLDLGRPERFWHMLVDAGGGGLGFKYWSPMSVGAWILLVFGGFATVSCVGALAPASGLGALLAGGFGRWFHGIGALAGLALAGYTGVLLSVSNVRVWSDSWALGGLFLASGLGIAAAVLGLLAARRGESATTAKLWRVDGWFLKLELGVLLVFFVTLRGVPAEFARGPCLALWVVVLAGNLAPLALHARASPGRAVLAPVLVLLGGLALRTVVVLGPQTPS